MIRYAPIAPTAKQEKLAAKAAARTNHGNITAEQEAYCRGRAMGMSPAEAVAAAGLKYKEETCRKWEYNNDHVKARIAELSEIATKNAIIKTGLDREWVITKLMTVVDRCMQEEQVLDKKGKPTGEYKFDAAGANAALKMLGDTMGLFKPAEKKPGDEYEELSDDDIARIAGELASQVGLLASPAGNEASAREEQVVTLSALPEADVLSQRWSAVPGEAVSSRQPVGQDLEQRLRGGPPPDGQIPGLVAGQEVVSWGDGLGAGRVDGIDPRHDAAPHHGTAGGVGDRDNSGRPDPGREEGAGDRGLA
jgi:hypothetical protein